jgi:hypothetical protein
MRNTAGFVKHNPGSKMTLGVYEKFPVTPRNDQKTPSSKHSFNSNHFKPNFLDFPTFLSI